MPKEAVLNFQGNLVKTNLTKVDRNKVYGWSEEVYNDKSGHVCTWATLLNDGITLISSGGSALKTFNNVGNEVSKSDLVAVCDNGELANLISSIFDGETTLSNEKTIEDLMNLEVKSVYQLEILENQHLLKTWLAEFKVLYLPFNYRTDYESDDAFILNQGELFFIITGKIKDFAYASLQNTPNLELDSDESDEIDFNMF
jgi:prolyl-tRNA synthetase